MKRIASLLLAGALTLSLAACGGKPPAASSPAVSAPAASSPAASTPSGSGDPYAALDPVTLTGGDSSGKGAAAQLLGELIAGKVDQITGGKLTMDYFPNSELGNDLDILRQIQAGDLDLIVCQTANVVPFVPEMAVFDLPMVFSKYDGDTIDRVLNGADSAFRTQIAQAYEKGGFHLLGYLQNATYRLTTSNQALNTLADFSGMQIRTMENSNHMAFWSAIGANPTPLAWSEVYIALQNGTIDAQENASDTCATSNFHEVQKYLSCTNHILYLNQTCINAETYNNLDPAYQAALDQAVAEALAEIRPQLTQIDVDNKAKLEQNGMTIIEYEPEFYDSILNMDSVKQLYVNINTQVGGLGETLQKELESAAG